MPSFTLAAITLAAITLAAITLAAATMTAPPDAITVVDHPPTAARNSNYVSNREPLIATPFTELPIGAVQPHAWLRKQLELQSAGFHGHLTEISPWLKKENNAWLSTTGQGDHGWEEVPYWLKGFLPCAILLDDKEQIAEAKVWIEAALNSQAPDGMFGPRGRGATATVSSTKGPLDLWANMVMLNCLQTWYEYSHDPRVLDLMTKYFAFELTIPDKDFLPPYWQHQRGADNLASVYWLYNRTGSPELLTLADKIHRCTADWTDGVPDWHNVNMTQAFGGPATYYQQSHDLKHLAAAERNWELIRNMFGQVPGGLFGGDENCREGYCDPRQAVETCGMVEFMLSAERLVRITGNPVWADRCEDVAFNSLPAAVMPDFSGLRYLTAPNMVKSDRASKAPELDNGGNMYEMRADDHRCCQHNFGHGWPYFAEHQWMATADNGLAAVFHCASTVTAKVADGKEVSITAATEYPFEDTIRYTIKCDAALSFPLYVRIPGWCDSAKVEINADAAPIQSRPDAYVRLERAWKNNDTITLTLPMHVALRTWRANHDSVSVDRGPLTYSLKIGEKYVTEGGTPTWPGHEILPTTPWNYALVIDGAEPGNSFQVVTHDYPKNDTPFTETSVPMALKAKGRRIPAWKEDYLGLVGLLQDSPAKTSEPVEEVTLIPMGAARLRISAFPVVGDGSDSHQWVTPPEAKPLKITASHCNESDTVRAVADGKDPRNSNDHLGARFTWWNHKGTSEWIAWEFDAPKKVGKVRVYWFDDEPSGGQCRTPASWTLKYRKNGEWIPVKTTGTFGVEKNRYNEVSFDPIETDSLRIDVQLREGVSAGILEWRIE